MNILKFYSLLVVSVNYCAAASRPQFRWTIFWNLSCSACQPVNCVSSAPFASRNNMKFHCNYEKENGIEIKIAMIRVAINVLLWLENVLNGIGVIQLGG